MADEKVAEAVDIIAHHCVWRVLEDATGEMWEDYPDLDLTDWEAVDKRVMEIAENARPTKEGFDAAYEYLRERAEQWERANGPLA